MFISCSFHVHLRSTSWMIALVGWEGIPFHSSLKGLCCHGSPLYEKAQSSILSTWIGLLLLLPYKPLKLLILISDPCAYKIGTSLPLLKIFCLEGQTPAAHELWWSTDLFQPQRVLLLDTGPHLDVHNVLPVQNLRAVLKRKYLLKISEQDMNVIPNLLFLHSSPRSVTLEMCPCILLGRLCMRNFHVSSPLSFITEHLALFILFFFLFLQYFSDSVYQNLFERFRTIQK